MQPNLLTILCWVAVIGVLFVLFNTLKGVIVATSSELASRINALADKADKAKTEIVDAVQSLKDQLAAAQVDNPEVTAALARLDGSVQALDDLNPDAATEPQTPEGEQPQTA